MRYPQTFIDDLKRQADIVRVVQDYVTLKKKGANWMACCPFHKEKTPSFSVSPAKEIFYCFGCHKGGSVFNFRDGDRARRFSRSDQDRCRQKSACRCPRWLTTVALKHGDRKLDQVIELNKWALEWWQQQLEHGGAESQIGREYLAAARNHRRDAKRFSSRLCAGQLGGTFNSSATKGCDSGSN